MSQDQAVAAPSRTSTFRNELNDAVGICSPRMRPALIVHDARHMFAALLFRVCCSTFVAAERLFLVQHDPHNRRRS